MKNQNQNLLVAVAIWLACMFGLYLFFPNVMGGKRAAQHKPEPAVQAPPPVAAPAPAPSGTGTAITQKPADVPRGTPAAKPPLRTVTFETARTRVVATSEGAAVQSVQLIGEKWTRHKGLKDESQVDLASLHGGEQLPFSTVVSGADGKQIVPAVTAYELLKSDATS